MYYSEEEEGAAIALSWNIHSQQQSMHFSLTAACWMTEEKKRARTAGSFHRPCISYATYILQTTNWVPLTSPTDDWEQFSEERFSSSYTAPFNLLLSYSNKALLLCRFCVSPGSENGARKMNCRGVTWNSNICESQLYIPLSLIILDHLISLLGHYSQE